MTDGRKGPSSRETVYGSGRGDALAIPDCLARDGCPGTRTRLSTTSRRPSSVRRESFPCSGPLAHPAPTVVAEGGDAHGNAALAEEAPEGVAIHERAGGHDSEALDHPDGTDDDEQRGNHAADHGLSLATRVTRTLLGLKVVTGRRPFRKGSAHGAGLPPPHGYPRPQRHPRPGRPWPPWRCRRFRVRRYPAAPATTRGSLAGCAQTRPGVRRLGCEDRTGRPIGVQPLGKGSWPFSAPGDEPASLSRARLTAPSIRASEGTGR